MKTASTVVFYDGPSAFTGEPILGVVTGLRVKTKNPKTGDMCQAWIILRDVSPSEAVETGRDASICGSCALRGDGLSGRGCYVAYWQAATNVWKARASYPRVTPTQAGWILYGKRVRLGAYGDPAAIPADAWESLIRKTSGSIGYTQRWATCEPGYKRFLMASVLSSVDQEIAALAGWRTYRLRGPRDPLATGEIVCPASNEADHKLTCAECLLCGGVDGKKRTANPTIVGHGKPSNLIALGMRAPSARPYRSIRLAVVR